VGEKEKLENARAGLTRTGTGVAFVIPQNDALTRRATKEVPGEVGVQLNAG
jgi:hypothetical protein